ncbi:hypothetical protein OG21DRAFT_1468300 [Imleria badia]|nr:hypothetical protein OG21DRAFT_1468300 [Imleria badia]
MSFAYSWILALSIRTFLVSRLWVLTTPCARVLYAAAVYPIQAPLSVTQNAPALAWMWFLRSFAGVWGVTIGSAVLQNELSKMLPASFIQSVTQGTAVPNLYALIPDLSTLPPDVRSEVQVAFARSLAVLWQVLTAICAVGAVASLFMRGLPLSHKLDETWAINREKDQDKEAADGGIGH